MEETINEEKSLAIQLKVVVKLAFSMLICPAESMSSLVGREDELKKSSKKKSPHTLTMPQKKADMIPTIAIQSIRKKEIGLL